MTPKEKAKELVNLFYQDLHLHAKEHLGLDLDQTHSSKRLWNFSKVFANKCAQEIIDNIDYTGEGDEGSSYWETVIEEIENA